MDQDLEGSLYATPFILSRDTTNRFKVDQLLERSLAQDLAIPFLRSKLSPDIVRGSQRATRRSPSKLRRRLNQREQGWNSYVKPISTYNEKVHKAMRIPFERL